MNNLCTSNYPLYSIKMSKANTIDSCSRKTLSITVLVLGISILLLTVAVSDGKRGKRRKLKPVRVVKSTTTTTTMTTATTTKTEPTTEKLEELYAVPLADSVLTARLLDVVKEACLRNLLERGTKTATFAAVVGLADLVIMAADTSPLAVLRTLIRFCKKDSIPFIFVPSQSDLGLSCGLDISAASCAILKIANVTTDAENLLRDIKALTKEQEYLPPTITTTAGPSVTLSL